MPTIERIQLPPDGSRLKERWPLCQGLEAMYLMNQGAGTRLYDRSPYGRHGTIYGATWGAHGLTFNGSSHYVDLGAAGLCGLTSTSLMTLTALCRSASTSHTGMILNAGGPSLDEWGLYHYSTDTLYGNLGNQYPMSSAAFGTAWRVVALTNGASAGSRVRLYMDGALVGGPVYAGSDTGSTGACIGRRGRSSTLFFKGSIALVAIHSRALSDAENSQFYRELLNFEMFETPSQAHRRRLLA